MTRRSGRAAVARPSTAVAAVALLAALSLLAPAVGGRSFRARAAAAGRRAAGGRRLPLGSSPPPPRRLRKDGSKRGDDQGSDPGAGADYGSPPKGSKKGAQGEQAAPARGDGRSSPLDAGGWAKTSSPTAAPVAALPSPVPPPLGDEAPTTATPTIAPSHGSTMFMSMIGSTPPPPPSPTPPPPGPSSSPPPPSAVVDASLSLRLRGMTSIMDDCALGLFERSCGSFLGEELGSGGELLYPVGEVGCRVGTQQLFSGTGGGTVRRRTVSYGVNGRRTVRRLSDARVLTVDVNVTGVPMDRESVDASTFEEMVRLAMSRGDAEFLNQMRSNYKDVSCIQDFDALESIQVISKASTVVEEPPPNNDKQLLYFALLVVGLVALQSLVIWWFCVRPRKKKLRGSGGGGGRDHEVAATSLVDFALRMPLVGSRVNRRRQLHFCAAGERRPHRMPAVTDRADYDTLEDRTYRGRHLPPAPREYVDSLPPLERVRTIFERPPGTSRAPCPESTLLFATFARHLVDDFVRSRLDAAGGDVEDDDASETSSVGFDWARERSRHNVGLSQLYGDAVERTNQLRLRCDEPGFKGRMKTQRIDGREWPPFLYDATVVKKREFSALPDPPGRAGGAMGARQKRTLFAFGGSRANASPNVAAWNALLLRDHNRLAGEIERSEPSWDDERVFRTARNVLLAIYLKLVVEEYASHVAGVKFKVEPGEWMWDASWTRPNWISHEVATLSAWHDIGAADDSDWDASYDNGLLLDRDRGLGGDLREAFVRINDERVAAREPFNAGEPSVRKELAAVERGRRDAVASYAEYAAYLGLRPVKTFADIAKDPGVQRALEEAYGTPDRVEFYVGVLAADADRGKVFGTAAIRFLVHDAFGQALTHPLLSKNVWRNGAEVFGEYGWKEVRKSVGIHDILTRNL